MNAHANAGNKAATAQRTQRKLSRLPAVLVRSAAVAALVGLTALSMAQLGELRGELAYVRFVQGRELAEKSSYPAGIAAAIKQATREVKLTIRYNHGNADLFVDTAEACLAWSRHRALDPLTQLRIGEMAVSTSLLAIRVAPSDYTTWLCSARAHAALALPEQSRLCRLRAQELAPPGMKLPVLTSDLHSVRTRPTERESPAS